ncbi:MAG: hypothetical protein LBU87_03545 [Lactobacillales bacterium]|jgi:hypothetical protein|nr:hypothetical protein [Lactobacillales bacterium]
MPTQDLEDRLKLEQKLAIPFNKMRAMLEHNEFLDAKEYRKDPEFTMLNMHRVFENALPLSFDGFAEKTPFILTSIQTNEGEEYDYLSRLRLDLERFIKKDPETNRKKYTQFVKAVFSNSNFDKIQTMSKELIDRGANIHLLSYFPEEWFLIKKDGVEMLKSMKNIFVHNDVYKEYIKKTLAIYSNDIKEFEKYYNVTKFPDFLTLCNETKIWEQVLKMYDGNPDGFLKLMSQTYPENIELLFMNEENVVNFTKYCVKNNISMACDDYVSILGPMCRQILINPDKNDLFDDLTPKADMNVKARIIQELFSGSYKESAKNGWEILKQNMTVQDKTTGRYKIDPESKMEFVNRVHSMFNFAEKYNMVSFFSKNIVRYIPATCFQEVVQVANKKCLKGIFDMFFKGDFTKASEIASTDYFSGMTYKNKPLLFGLLYDNVITAKEMCDAVEKMSLAKMPSHLINGILLPCPSDTANEHPALNNAVLAGFSENSDFIQKWIACHKNPEKILSTVYFAKSKGENIQDADIAVLKKHNMGTYFFRHFNKETEAFLDRLDSEQIKALCQDTDKNILHALFEHNETASINWMAKKHPELFTEFVWQNDANGNWPLQKAHPAFLRKLHANASKTGDGFVETILADYFEMENITFEKPTVEKTATVSKETLSPFKSAFAAAESAPAKPEKQVLTNRTYDKNIRNYANGKAMINKAIAKITAPDFGPLEARQDAHYSSQDGLYVHFVSNHYRILYALDFTKNAVMLLDVITAAEGLKTWSDTQKRMYADHAHTTFVQLPDASQPVARAGAGHIGLSKSTRWARQK